MVIWKKGEGIKKPFTALCPSICNSLEPAEHTSWNQAMVSKFGLIFSPQIQSSPTEAGVSRSGYSALTITRDSSPHMVARAVISQATTSLGIKVENFFIVWKRRAWIICADGCTQATESTVAVPGTRPHRLLPLSLFLPWQHCAGCQSHRCQRPSDSQHPGTNVRSCERWPCCRRQDTAEGLMLCPCWSSRSTPPNVPVRRISLYLASKREGDPITTFPFPTLTRSWPTPGYSCQGHAAGGQAVLSLHVHGECSIPPQHEFALCTVGFI